MKILFIAPSLSSLWGGTTSAISNLALSLVQKGMSVTVACPDDGDSAATAARLTEQGIETLLFDVVFKPWLWCPVLNRYLKDYIKKFDICHIHGHWLYPHYIAAKYAARFGVPYIITSHGMLQPWALKHKGEKKRLYWSIIEKKNLNKASGIHAITSNEQQRILALTSHPNLFVVSNGIWLDRNDLSNNIKTTQHMNQQTHTKKTILFLGRLHSIKGLDMLIPAFARSLKHYPDWQLVLAGPDEHGYRKKLEKIINTYDISENVSFAGLVKENKREQLLQSADIFTLTSRSEGFSMVALEALSYSLPLLITSTCNFSEVGRHNAGIIVEPKIKSIHNGLTQLMAMKDNKRKALGVNGYNLVRKNYSWPHIARQMIMEYKTIVDIKK